MKNFLAICLMLLVLGWIIDTCDGDDSNYGTNSSSENSESGSAGTGDEDSDLACDHFRNVTSDVVDGILTDAEIREKAKEINDNAIIGTPSVQAGAKALLRAATAGDPDAYVAASQQLNEACIAAGS